jgi:choline dehydrogenase-like flavoprotein
MGLSSESAKSHLVIGSGPAGVAAAWALITRGCSVIMIDVGHELTAERSVFASNLGKTHHSRWSPADRLWLSQSMTDSRSKVPLKYLFGQDFAYKNHEWVVEQPFPPNGFAQFPSHGYGGLSRVWGATAMRMHPSDFASWPINADNLEAHYQSILSLIPITEDEEMDDLSREYGRVSTRSQIKLSDQATLILNRMRTQRDALREVGFIAGRSRIAVQENCNLCGACMYGCPYDNIFSSIQLMPALLKNPNFVYRPGLRVIRIEEKGSSVKAYCLDKVNEQHVISGQRAFVGAGALNTTKLVLSSHDAWDTTLTLKDSQYFLLPFLGPKANPLAAHQTLSQIFGKIKQLDLSPRWLHVQLYTYNELYALQIEKSMGPLRHVPGSNWLANNLALRLTVAQGYLPSIQSDFATVSLTGTASNSVLKVIPQRNSATVANTRKVWRYLEKIGRKIGLTALTPFGEHADVGRGYHTGGTFPMSAKPDTLWHSDSLGRTGLWKRVHIVDAAAWPEIPSGPVTLTVMANAHRIADEAAAIDLR